MKNFKRFLNSATLVVFLCSNFLIPVVYAKIEIPTNGNKGTDNEIDEKVIEDSILQNIQESTIMENSPINPLDIVIQVTATETNQTLTIKKYFNNAYTVDRGDGSDVKKLTESITHTYVSPGKYNIYLSLTGGANRWTFKKNFDGTSLIPQSGTTTTEIKIISMPSLTDGFGPNKTSVGDHFFGYFNYNGAIESFPEGSFDTSNITQAGFGFFDRFNEEGKLTNLPEGSFDTSNITTGGDSFFYAFNKNGALTNLPESSFNISKIAKLGNNCFSNFNAYGKLTSLPTGSFNMSNIKTVGTDFFGEFNYYGALTSLPEGSFDTSNITTIGNYFFWYFNYYGALTSLPNSFKMNSTGVSVNGGYENAFNSPNYIINKNVSALVGGIDTPLSDKNTFSDNNPGRCGTNAYWLVTTTDACHIIYDANGGTGSTVGGYNSDISSVNVGAGIIAPTKEGYFIDGWHNSIGDNVETIFFPAMDNEKLYAQWKKCENGYTASFSGTSCVLIGYNIILDLGGGYLEDENGNKYGGTQNINYIYDSKNDSYRPNLDPKTIKKENNIFIGWYTSNEGGEKIETLDNVDIAEEKLYAHRKECEAGYKEQDNKCVNEKAEYKYENGIIKISDGNDRIYFKDRNEGVDNEIIKDFRIYLSYASFEVAGNKIQEECNYDEECVERKILDYINEKSGTSFDSMEKLIEYFNEKNIEYIIAGFAGNLYFRGNNTGANIIELLENLGNTAYENEIIFKGFNGGKFGNIEGSGWIEGNYNNPCNWDKGEYLPTIGDWEKLLLLRANINNYDVKDISDKNIHFINSNSNTLGVTFDYQVLFDFILDTMLYPPFLTYTYSGNKLERFDSNYFMPIAWGGLNTNGAFGMSLFNQSGYTSIDDITFDFGTEYLESNQLTEEAVEKINSITLPVRCFIKVPVVKFETNGGSSMDDIDVFKGEKIVLENQPSKANATFDGWYKDEGLTENWDIENDIVEDDMTLYAKWIEKENKPSGGSSGGGGGGGSSKSDTQKEEKTPTDTPEQTSQDDKTQESQATEQASNEITQNNKQDTQDSQTTPINTPGGPEYSNEFQQAYTFAKGKGITSMPTIQEAKMNSSLTRISMAKMLSQYAINVLGQKPDISRGTINFNDVSNKMDADYDNGVTLAYQLGIMGQNMPNNNFRPNDEVTRAEFVTALSRMLFNIEDGKGNIKYYEPHMAKLFNEGIITNTNPKLKEKRGYVMIMLMRTAK